MGTQIYEVLSCTRNSKYKHFAATTLEFWLMVQCFSSISVAIPRTQGILPRHKKTGRQTPGTGNSDMQHLSDTRVSEHNSKSNNPRSGHSSSWTGPVHSAHSRNSLPEARVSIHIRKTKFQAHTK